MLKIFKRKTTIEKLEASYKKCLEEAYELSKTNRRASDDKMAQADNILKQIELLKQNKL